ncbi:MAG: (2Fe-2S)-binding protein [Rubrivivax sp.]|nr:(2Fe-2S)-binding protein [Rubrivivax sp.]
MFKRSEQASVGPDQAVSLHIAGRAVSAREGDSVAAAMLAAGISSCRTTPVSGAPRAPYCMMGVCFDCLVEIDGAANQQACMTAVRAAMVVQPQQGKRALDDGSGSGDGGPQ